MSTPDPMAVLLDGLLDDAAVFPPGHAPLDIAVAQHLARRRFPPLFPAWPVVPGTTGSGGNNGGKTRGPVGPLLIGVADVHRLPDLVRPGDDLAVAVIARPGVDLADALAAAAVVDRHPDLRLAGLDVAWAADLPRRWPVDVPVALELPRGTDLTTAVLDIAGRRAAGGNVLAKFRTGPTPTWPWPNEAELALVLHALVRARVRFKLTGGLHHAVRQWLGGEEHHGLLNVVLAIRAALDGATPLALTVVLANPEPTNLAARVGALTTEQVAQVRELFSSYGCCDVCDPLGELADLTLISAADLAASAFAVARPSTPDLDEEFA